jgi:hypothetical protein
MLSGRWIPPPPGGRAHGAARGGAAGEAGLTCERRRARWPRLRSHAPNPRRSGNKVESPGSLQQVEIYPHGTYCQTTARRSPSIVREAWPTRPAHREPNCESGRPVWVEASKEDAAGGWLWILPMDDALSAALESRHSLELSVPETSALTRTSLSTIDVTAECGSDVEYNGQRDSI